MFVGPYVAVGAGADGEAAGAQGASEKAADEQGSEGFGEAGADCEEEGRREER